MKLLVMGLPLSITEAHFTLVFGAIMALQVASMS
jgi:hypothetical protein